MSLLWLIIIIGLAIAVIGYLLVIDINNLIFLTIIAIFFPIHIQFMGRDALTTGTIFIFILYLKYILDALHSKKYLKEKYDTIIHTLIIFGALSIILPIFNGSMQSTYIGPSIRHYVDFMSSVIIFLILKNLIIEKNKNGNEKALDFTDKILALIIVLIVAHVLISLIVKFEPSFGQYFKIFLARDEYVFDSVDRHNIQRIGSFVFGPEAFGEILAILCPILLYKIRFKNRWFWIVCLVIFLLGLIFSITRSGIVLFATTLFVANIYCYRRNLNKTLYMMMVTGAVVAGILLSYPQIFGDLFTRFNDAKYAISSGNTIFEILNRDFMPDVLRTVFASLNFFGNGFTEFNYHNLYLTTLHQKGIIGGGIFFIILSSPLIYSLKEFSKIKTERLKVFTFVCIVAMCAFFVNELKYEFNRAASYQQICWAIFATFYQKRDSFVQKVSSKEWFQKKLRN